MSLEGGPLTKPSFDEWLKVMGSEISLEGWTRYRGDMGSTGKAWHGEWNGLDGARSDL